MTCREASEFLLEYVAAELDEEVCAEFDAHLVGCPNCHNFVAQYRATVAAGRNAFAPTDADAATQLPEEVVRAILAALGKAEH